VVFRRDSRCVGVFPPELNVVVLVCHHRVSRRAFTPTVASDAGVPIETWPLLYECPGILSVVPRILLEGRVVDGVPDVHADSLVKGLLVLLAREGWELGVVTVAVEVSLPACLQAGARRVHSLQIQLGQWSGLPDVASIRLCYLLDDIVLVDVEDVELLIVSRITNRRVRLTYVLSRVQADRYS